MSKIIEEAKRRYKIASEAWDENKTAALEDLRFAKMGEQWPDEIKRDRERDARPALTFNKLVPIIRQVVNDARINTPSIKVHPVDDSGDPQTAEVINGLVRSIEKNSQADTAYDTAIDGSVSTGFGFFRIDMDYARYDTWDMDIEVNPIANQFSVVPYPYSTEHDASDWEYCFVENDMSHEAFKEAYPNAKLVDWQSTDDSAWITEDTIKVCEYWTREAKDTEIYLLSNGITVEKDQYEENFELFSSFEIVKSRETQTYKVKQRILTASEVLEETDWPGRFIPIVPVYGEEVNNGDSRLFKSLIRDAKDAQMNYNFQRTAYTERTGLSTKAPWVGPVGAFDTDSRKWESANSENWPYLEYDGPVPPQQTMPNAPDVGLMQDALAASDEIKSITGVHNSSLGINDPQLQSGRAILAKQREGDVSTYHFIDNLSRAIRYAGRVILDLIPHVYDGPRTVRTLGFDGQADSVKINEQFVQNGIIKMHDLTAGKYDLVVDTGPSFSTQREEAREFLVEVGRSDPRIYEIAGDLLMKNMDIPGADEIAKRLKALLPPQIQAMEDLEGLPPEAQAVVAQSKQQVQQLMQVIEQGKQMLAEKDKQIEKLEIDMRNKMMEVQAKNLDSQRDYSAAMAKILSDKEIAADKITEAQRSTIVDLVKDIMNTHMSAASAPEYFEENYEQLS